MKLSGKVHEVGTTQQVSENFSKRNLVIEYSENPSYPEYINFELHQDKTALADSLKSGDNVEIEFNLRGRPWTDKAGKTSYFNTLVIWKLSSSNTTGYVPASLPSTPGESDDLPF